MAGKGFVQAEKLGIGSQIVTRAGPPLMVKRVTRKSRPEGYTVYNLVVEGDHTYFVGTANGGAWVHNPTDCPLPGDYLASKAPMQVTPGTRVLRGQYVDDLGRVQPWEAHYDEYGRLIGRTDYNAGNKVMGYEATHYHTYDY